MENGEQRRNWWLVLSDSDHKRDYDDYDYDDDYDNGGKDDDDKSMCTKSNMWVVVSAEGHL